MSKLNESLNNAIDNLDAFYLTESDNNVKSELETVISKFNSKLPSLDLKINGDIDEILEDLEIYLDEIEVDEDGDFTSNYDSFNIQGKITWGSWIEQAIADYIVESLDDNDFFTTSNSEESDEDPVAFDKETELNKLHADDIYYEIAEALHLDTESAEEIIRDIKNRLDELDIEPEKYLELVKQYIADGKDVNSILDDIEFGPEE